jgi:hypothetical protein
MSMADELAAILAGWREAASKPPPDMAGREHWLITEADTEFIVTARTAMPRLVAAAERLSELADEWDADAAELDRDIARARKSPHASDHAQARTDEALAGELRGCGAKVREIITAALTGKGSSNGD